MRLLEKAKASQSPSTLPPPKLERVETINAQTKKIEIDDVAKDTWIMAIKDGNLTEIKACIEKYGKKVLELRDSNKKQHFISRLTMEAWRDPNSLSKSTVSTWPTQLTNWREIRFCWLRKVEKLTKLST